MRRSRRWPWLAVVLLLSMIACYADPPTRIYVEDFETFCDGSPCGWERARGTADQATVVSTIHPGEHGLRLEGIVSVRGPAATEDDDTIFGSFVDARIVARCDPGSTLTLDVLAVEPTTGIVWTATETVPAGSEWTDPISVSLSFDGSPANARVTAVVLSKTGSGACEIDEIAIDDTDLDKTGC